jgi:hypothetical protein
MFLEYVQGGELFTHLRDEGMFEPHKSAYPSPYIAFTLHTLSSFSSICTVGTSSTVISNLRTYSLRLMVTSNLQISVLPRPSIIELSRSVERLSIWPRKYYRIRGMVNRWTGGLWAC